MAKKYKKRADGRYLVQVKKGVKENGRPDYENVYAYTIEDLERDVAAFKDMLKKGIVIDDEGLTLEKWAKRWLEVYKSGKELNTYKMYSNAINKHILPALGHYKLKDLKLHHIQELINKKAKEGYTKTIINIKQTISQMLAMAVEDEYIFKNVAAKVVMPKKEKTKKRSLTEAEKKYICNADLDLRSKAFIYTLLYSGVRRGEILALTKKDIDFSTKRIIIDKSVIFDVNKPILKPTPKSDAGNRSIPIPDVLFNVLTEYLTDLDSSQHIFTSVKGKIMTQAAFRRLWEKILRHIQKVVEHETEGKEKLAKDITPHIFRHTYATSLYYAGVDVKAAQYLLGHNSIEITLELYTHLDEANDKKTADKINSYLELLNPIQSEISQK